MTPWGKAGEVGDGAGMSYFDGYFRKTFRVTLKPELLVGDFHGCQRIIQGQLLAVDHQGNLLVDGSKEYVRKKLVGSEQEPKIDKEIHQRYLGLVCIPRKCLDKIEVEKWEDGSFKASSESESTKDLSERVEDFAI